MSGVNEWASFASIFHENDFANNKAWVCWWEEDILRPEMRAQYSALDGKTSFSLRGRFPNFLSLFLLKHLPCRSLLARRLLQCTARITFLAVALARSLLQFWWMFICLASYCQLLYHPYFTPFMSRRRGNAFHTLVSLLFRCRDWKYSRWNMRWKTVFCINFSHSSRMPIIHFPFPPFLGLLFTKLLSGSRFFQVSLEFLKRFTIDLMLKNVLSYLF